MNWGEAMWGPSLGWGQIYRSGILFNSETFSSGAQGDGAVQFIQGWALLGE